MALLGESMIGHLMAMAMAMAMLRSCAASGVHTTRSSSYPAVFVFGTSLSDTGNGAVLAGNASDVVSRLAFGRTTMLPYGETFPGHPFFRFSDGRLFIDFLASFLGLPFLNPYLNSSADFSFGINYAVSGATALNSSFLNSKGVFPLTSLSLEVQLGWHLQALQASLQGGSSEGPGKPNATSFTTGLYVIFIGNNDYNYAFQSRYTPSEVNATFVPPVVKEIRDVSERLYGSGSRNFLLIGIYPLGCLSSLLSTNLLAAKDGNGCLKDFNSVAENHRSQLRKEVESLRTAHPDGSFTYIDLYGAYESILQKSNSFGFTETLKTCCGAGPLAPYNFNTLEFCSNSTRSICSNPNGYLQWDGIHFTESLNRQLFNQTVLQGTYMDPPNGLGVCATHNGNRIGGTL